MIPNKSSFKFQELTPITGVKPYVLRFWETEFEDISPISSDSGQKIYSRKDVETILKIKKLLFEEKMSIPEAKLAIKSIEIDLSSLPGPSAFEELVDGPGARGALLDALNILKEIKSKRNW